MPATSKLGPYKNSQPARANDASWFGNTPSTSVAGVRPGVDDQLRAAQRMNLVQAALSQTGDLALPEVAVRVDRQKLARRRWRGTADDGEDFGFEVQTPLQHGDVVWVGAKARYVIRQTAEPLLEIPIDVAPDQAAVIGWAVGNMHFVIEAQEKRILAPDDSGLRQALDRIGVEYRVTAGVFQPHRFATVVGHSHGHPAPDAEVDNHPYVRAVRPKS